MNGGFENINQFQIWLGGGFNCFCIFTPIPGEMVQFDDRIFFKWVVQPSTKFLGSFNATHFFEGESNLTQIVAGNFEVISPRTKCPLFLVKLARDLTRPIYPQKVAEKGRSPYFREI